ncbi:hypothetical protein JCM19231_3086 [Vibrio ishigakensis]|uniref:CopG family transcriptional regulator n=1 Tax=Vibrio ishigakensis TaxID=1481914 RepID=A0A0B8NVE8_9VIBR|nr:hypothetical protein [Vibrio ishigakensis]GAM58480.1 hypothetical protein JCM19231_3086 [Vibrio ishigakensis]
MRNRDTEARLFVRGAELEALKKLSQQHQVNLTEMVRILITNAITNAERAGVNDESTTNI